MFIKKIKITDNVTDPLKEKLGKALIQVNNKLVENTNTEEVRQIEYQGSSFHNTAEGLYEIIQQATYDGNSTDIPLTIFVDHTAEIIAPVHRNEIAVNNDSKAVSSGYVKAKFNFLSEQYEQFTSDRSEVLLPCIYLENDPQQTKTIMDQKVFTRVTPKARDFYDFNERLANRYIAPDYRKTRNLMFGQNFSFSIGNAEREKYPFYNNIRFNYQTTNDFKNALKQFNFFEQFIDDYIDSPKPTTKFKVQVTQENSTVLLQDYGLFDALGWLQKSDFVFNDSNKLIFEPTQKTKSNYQYFLDKLAFFGKIRKFCRNNLKNLQQIHNNDNNKSEVLFYKIDKFVEASSTPVQTFWIPGDDNFVDYIDTQVKYGLKYTYQVTAFLMVFGCSYRYTNIREVNGKTKFDAVIKPSFKVISIGNIFNDYCRIIQPPQPVPAIQFVNESSKEDYIKIHMNLSINSDNSPLIPLNDIELGQEELRKQYDRLEERPRFVYNNERALYEIYRTDFIPEKYEDLRGHKIAEVRNSFASTGAVFKDYIDPWKKYYYVVRCINFHGFVSNPTPIYEIEITKDADESFLSVQSVPLRIEKVDQPTRTFMKLIQAIPATQHTYYDEQKLVESLDGVRSLKGLVLNKITLGNATHPIWGKKFKFRITSKETGKKLDVNIKVNLIKKKTMENSK